MKGALPPLPPPPPFPDYLSSCRIWNMWLVQDGEQIQIENVANSLIIFGASVNSY